MRIIVYDKAFTRKGSLGAPTSVEVDLIANGVGSATVVIPSHRPRVSDALADGARLVIDEPGVFKMSGPVVKRGGAGPNDESVTLTIEDDARLLTRILGWPAPTQPIGSQGLAYAKYTGTAETIFKNVTRANALRAGLPVTVAPDLLRGATIPGGLQFRFHPLADRLFPAVEQAGLVVSVMQEGAGLVVDVRVPKVVRRPFSVASGNLVAWSWSDANPTVTSVVAGGQGEGALRTALQSTDTARQAQYGDRIEQFIDARDTDEPAELSGRMAEALAEGAAKSGLDLTINNTKGFAYGAHYAVGDTVTVKAGPLEVTDILRTVHISFTRENGLVVTPAIGDRSDDPDLTLGKLVRRIRQDIRNLKVR